MAIPIKSSGASTSKTIFYVFLSGVTTGIGAFLGVIITNIASGIIGFCLSLAAGVMLYIIFIEILQESKAIYKGRVSSMGSIIGFILGLIASIIS